MVNAVKAKWLEKGIGEEKWLGQLNKSSSIYILPNQMSNCLFDLAGGEIFLENYTVAHFLFLLSSSLYNCFFLCLFSF